MKPNFFKKIIVLVSILSTSCLSVLASTSIILDHTQRQLLLDVLVPNIHELYPNKNQEEVSALEQKMLHGLMTYNDQSIAADLIELLPRMLSYVQHIGLDKNEDNSTRQGVMGTLEQILSELEHCCQQTDADFQATWSILAGLDDLTVTVTINLSSVFNALAPCGAVVPITGPITITSPGSYCLANDIVGVITIAADDVILDLNNKRVSNRSSTDSALSLTGTNITIKNGQINGSIFGISVNSCNYVRIDNVQFMFNSDTPLNIQDSCDVLISNAYFTQNNIDTKSLIQVFRSTNVQVIDTIMQANQGRALMISGVTEFVLDGCQIINNSSVGTHVIAAGNSSTDLTFKNSSICQNNYTAYMIGIENGSNNNVVLENLIIEDNKGGLYMVVVNNASGILVRNCVVSKNTGTSTTTGLYLSNSTDAIVERNSISANSGPNGSIGIQINNASATIIANEVQGKSTAENYVLTGSGAIPIVEFSQSTATVTVISGGPNPTSYHNLSVIP